MASKAEKISEALNSARASNLINCIGEDRIRCLFEEYLSDSEGEEVEEDVEEEGARSSGASSSRSRSAFEVGVAEPEVLAEDPDTDGDDPEDEDLVVDVGRDVELENEVVLERDPELAKIEAFKCGCSLKLPSGETGCIKQFELEWIFQRRLSMNELSNEAKDFYVKGLLDSPTIADTELTLHKRESRRKERTFKRRIYCIHGKQVCRPAFLFLHCLGKGRLDSLQKSSLAGREKGKLGGRVYNTKALSPEDLERVVKFIKSFAEDNGLALPGRIPGYHRTGLKLLPSQYTKISVWKTYEAVCQESGHRAVGQTSFRTTWLQYLPNIVVARPMTDLCHVCQSNNNIIFKTVKATDSSKMKLLDNQMDHIRRVNIERDLYRQQVQASREVIAELGVTGLRTSPPCSLPTKMLYAFDYAQQVHLPSSPMQPGPIYFLTPRKCGLFGVCCPGVPEQVNFVVDEGVCCGKGSNSVISYLHFFFSRFGLGETEAVLYCDNCSGQNKNNYMLWYLLWRVAHGFHKRISLNFMVPGHTKFAPDWCFGLLKQNFRRSEVHCLNDMCSVIEGSATKVNKAQLVGLEDGTILVPTYNWQDFLSPFFKTLKGIKSLFHFTFENGSTVIARSTEGEETKHVLLKNPANLPPKDLPEPLTPPGLSLERSKYLHDNIRQFVKEDCKDLLCPAVNV